MLVINQEPAFHFKDRVTKEDADLHNFELHSSKSQQAVEALCILVALRMWCHKWKGTRSLLVVRSDSVTALTLLMYSRSKGPTTALVAREIALDVAEGI